MWLRTKLQGSTQLVTKSPALSPMSPGPRGPAWSLVRHPRGGVQHQDTAAARARLSSCPRRRRHSHNLQSARRVRPWGRGPTAVMGTARGPFLLRAGSPPSKPRAHGLHGQRPRPFLRRQKPPACERSAPAPAPAHASRALTAAAHHLQGADAGLGVLLVGVLLVGVLLGVVRHRPALHHHRRGPGGLGCQGARTWWRGLRARGELGTPPVPWGQCCGP